MKSTCISLLGAAFLCLAACSPEVLTMNVDMRYPSASGHDFSRRSMAVVTMQEGKQDSLFNAALATGLTESLEADYFNGEESIALYRIPADTVTLDLMHALVMDTGADVIFLFTPPQLDSIKLTENTPVEKAQNVDEAFVTIANIPFRSRMVIYDSMGKEDKLYTYAGKSVLRPAVFNNGVTAPEFLKEAALQKLAPQAESVGKRFSADFLPTWKTERYSLYYYMTWEDEWLVPAYHAMEYDWQQAVKGWMGFLQEKNAEKKACACYNIALAFHMMGDQKLALRWIEEADKSWPLTLSPGLRKRIEARL